MVQHLHFDPVSPVSLRFARPEILIVLECSDAVKFDFISNFDSGRTNFNTVPRGGEGGCQRVPGRSLGLHVGLGRMMLLLLWVLHRVT